MRILIAEDDMTCRTVLAGMLQREGHEVTAATDGAEAWHLLQQPEAPLLAILDWVMPELDGPEVVRRVRALGAECPPYLIMLTTRDEKSDVIAGLEAGANDYLAKPFHPGELRVRVEVGRRMIEMQQALLESKRVLAHQATHDGLTGLPNRRAILERLREETARATRGGMLAVGMCDIDHFKAVNDTHGHPVGDEVLRAVAQVLSDSLREYDTVGRMGGEEFLVVAPVRQREDCLALFDRLCSAVAATEIWTREGALKVTASFGVACSGGVEATGDLLHQADAALYCAKHEGRNRVCYSMPLSGRSEAA